MMERIRRRWLESRFITPIPPTPPPNFFSELANEAFRLILHVTEYAKLATPLGHLGIVCVNTIHVWYKFEVGLSHSSLK